MDLFLQTMLNGVLVGSIYTLVALGFVIVFSIMFVSNLAHGELYMIGAFVVWGVLLFVIHNWFVAILVSLIVGGFLGVGIERLFRPVMTGNLFSQLLVGFGLSILLQEVVALVANPLSKGTGVIYGTVRELGPLRISDQRIIVIVVALLLTLLVFLFFNRNRLGKAMRATSSDRFAAGCCGINAKRMAIYAFVIAGAITGVAGALLGPLYGINPYIGGPMLIIALMVSVIGGMGSLGGAAIFGVVFGMVLSFAQTYMSVSWSYPVLYAVFFVLVIIRPTGLFGMGSK